MSKLTGTVLVTGGTAGLGYEAALQIAQKHPEYQIIIASRTDPNNAATTINKATAQNTTTFLPLDLSSLANIRTFATTYSKKDYPPLQTLLLNAGAQFPNGVIYSTDGIEKTFAINHVGHALLFHLLTPHLAPSARIVVVSSGTHDPAQKTGLPDAIYDTAEELAHPTAQSAKYAGRQRYATSKLCNVMWTLALSRRLSANNSTSQNWTVNAFDPGLMPGTGLARDAGPMLRFLWNYILPYAIPVLRLLVAKHINTPAESGAELARLATAEDVEGVSGKYFEGFERIGSSVLSYDEGKQEDLWGWTVRAVARDGGEREVFERVYPVVG